MKETYGALRKLQNESSKSGKQAIIENNLDNPEFVEVMQFLVNPFIVTGISSKKILKDIGISSNIRLNSLSEVMQYLRENNTGRDVDIKAMKAFLFTLDFENDEIKIAEQIITKSLKIGVDTLWNATVPEKYKVPVFNVLLAKSYDDYIGKIDSKLKKGFTITKKLDGMRMVCVIDDYGDVKFFTRQGKAYEGLDEIEADVRKLDLRNVVLDGEIMSNITGTTNEIYADTGKARSKDKNKTGLVYHVFEWLPLKEFQNGKSKLNTIERKNTLHELLSSVNLTHIQEVEMLYCGKDISMIDVWTAYSTLNEWEGIMISLDEPYECKRSGSLLKVKKMMVGDCRCISVVEGDGKYKGMLGAIVIEFEHEGELHRCECGSGFNDHERQLYWDNPKLIESKIVEIQYFEISKNQNGGVGLRFPIWLSRIRLDKDEINMK